MKCRFGLRPGRGLLQLGDPLSQGLHFLRPFLLLGAGAQVGIRHPPVNANLARLVHRADEKPDLNGQELNVHELDLISPAITKPLSRIRSRTSARVADSTAWGMVRCGTTMVCSNAPSPHPSPPLGERRR